MSKPYQNSDERQEDESDQESDQRNGLFGAPALYEEEQNASDKDYKESKAKGRLSQITTHTTN